ncbi:MAG TPA: ABC transporter permease [Bryobacteraceae bacterium]|nr:ABC transporter permease [Bryobacteraceae bacterium]
MNWWRRLWTKNQLEQRLAAELRFHFDHQVADNIRAGMSEEEAHRKARLEFGSMDAVKEECRSARGTIWLESTLQDIRFALRTLRKSSAFTFAAICTLALGIGANTAIFELLDAVRLRSLPVPNPQELARIQIRNGNGGFFLSLDDYDVSYPLWEETRAHQQAFSGMFAWSSQWLRLGEGAQARRASALVVSGEMFSTLQVQPVAGRLFRREDDQPGCAAPGVVLGYDFWQSNFGGQHTAIGSRMVVNDVSLEVIGVAPATFSGVEVGKSFDLAVPICALSVLHRGDRSFQRLDYSWLIVMGRLKPGWTIAQASDHLSAISPGLFEATVPTGYAAASLERYKKFRLEAISARNGVSSLRAQYDDPLWLLLGITGLVLLIACGNLTNLMLARASARQREFALRLALGASRSRLIRQSLCESLLLASTGAALGLALAGALSKSILYFLSTEGDPLHLELSTDWRMLAFTATVGTLACAILGLAPALRSSHIEPGAAIKAAGRGLTTAREGFSFQRVLVVVQISVSLVLVVGALLFVQSFRNLMTVDLGFREKGILLAFFDMSRLRLPTGQIKTFKRELLDDIRSIPQVQAAATTTNVLIGGGMFSLGIRAGAVDDWSRFAWVSPRYLETLQIPLLAGRDFNAGDTETSPKVALVNQTFVHRFFANTDPIGKTFRTSPEPDYPETEYQIVGVIKDTKYFNLRGENPAMSYAPASQDPATWPSSVMYMRSSMPLGPLGAAIGRRLGESHPQMGTQFRAFQTHIEEGLIRERLMAALSSFFGALAALLATIGLYGVMAYMMVRRRNEIGIRVALGASRPQIVGLVMKEAALLLVIGVAAGVAGSLVFARTAATLLFGLTARDPLTFLAAAVLLAAAAALGSYLPAQRASRLDPMTALRDE